MAISTSTYFSNSLVGVPQVAGEFVDVLESTANPKFAVGTKFERQDGAVFRYAHFGAACTGGQVLCTVNTDVSYVQLTSSVISTSSTYQQNVEPIGVYPNGIGSRFIALSSVIKTCTNNDYTGGYIVASPHKNDGVYVNSTGVTYRIKKSDATTTSSPYYTKFELYDKLVATIPTSALISIAGNKFSDIAPGTAAAVGNNLPAGVATRNQTADYFGWVQTRGIGGVLIEGAAGGSAGDIAVLSTGMVGGAQVVALATTLGVAKNILGTLVQASSGSTFGLIDIGIGA